MVISVILRFFELAFVGQLKPSFVDIGRTGRAGRSGEAITLYTEDDKFNESLWLRGSILDLDLAKTEG